MKVYLFETTTLTALLASVFTLTASADDTTPCVELAKECFAYSGNERETCFKAVSTHSFCRETKTGALAAKRAQFSSLTPPQDQDGPSFLGPNLVNRSCVENFDNAWSVELIKGASNTEGYEGLEKILSKCAQVPSSDILRP